MFYINKNYLFIIAIIVVSVFFSCRKKEDVPVLITAAVSEITGSTAIGGGEITSEGSSSVISRGVCWSKVSSPTIYDNKTIDGTGSGSFSSNLTSLDAATGYYARAYATNSAGTGYGEQITFATIGQSPLPTAMAATSIGATTATLNAMVNANFLPTHVIFEYGITSAYGDSLRAEQSPLKGGTVSLVSTELKGLSSTTLYHYRVKAINQLGTTYGDDQMFTTMLSDVDGNSYNIVTIGSQVWMKENLKTTRYRNGDLIGTTSPVSLDITSLTTPKYQWAHAITDYGRLYTYHTITDSRNVCPVGWHVPTDGEWTSLTDYLSNNGYGFGGNASYIAKSLAAESGWTPDPTPGTVGNDQASNNSSGFSGFAGGGRYSSGVMNFVNLHGIWWSSTESSPSFAYFRCIGYIPEAVFRGVFSESYGLSVRCLKDN